MCEGIPRMTFPSMPSKRSTACTSKMEVVRFVRTFARKRPLTLTRGLETFQVTPMQSLWLLDFRPLTRWVDPDTDTASTGTSSRHWIWSGCCGRRRKSCGLRIRKYLKKSPSYNAWEAAIISKAGASVLKCAARYAMRMAEALIHRYPQTEVTIFYMDIQNCGKDFSKFYERSKNHIRFVRYMPGDIFQGEGDALTVCYGDEENGKAVRETFDLVVLSVGIMPGLSNPRLAQLLKLDSDRHGFLAPADSIDSTTTIHQGVFLAGTAQGPKDIADSMAQAGQAAQRVAQYLGVADGRSE